MSEEEAMHAERGQFSRRRVSEKVLSDMEHSPEQWPPATEEASKRVAHVAKVGDKKCVMMDGKPGKHYDRIIEGSLTFSPDWERLAYVAQESKQQFVVVDGQEQRAYDRILGRSGAHATGKAAVVDAFLGLAAFIVGYPLFVLWLVSVFVAWSSRSTPGGLTIRVPAWWL